MNMYDMDLPLDVSEETAGVSDLENPVIEAEYTELTEENIVPRVGCFLGLDISKDSTGVCFYKDGTKRTCNIHIEYDKNRPHMETIARYYLKNEIKKIIDGVSYFDVVVIEDVFEGDNPYVTRMLYALNTAIDELILDDVIYCKNFRRVSNKTWKKWLSGADEVGEFSKLNDKERVKGILESLGVCEDGKGYQDRLDATGMLIGYFLNEMTVVKGADGIGDFSEKANRVRVQFSDVLYAFEEDEDLIMMQALDSGEGITTVMIPDKKITKKKILDYLSTDCTVVYITKDPIRLGLLAKELGLDLLAGEGGYFGFWLKPKAIKKYISLGE